MFCGPSTANVSLGFVSGNIARLRSTKHAASLSPSQELLIRPLLRSPQTGLPHPHHRAHALQIPAFPVIPVQPVRYFPRQKKRLIIIASQTVKTEKQSVVT